MLRRAQVVTKKVKRKSQRESSRLPKEFSKGAVLAEWLMRRGIWKATVHGGRCQVAHRVRFGFHEDSKQHNGTG